VLRTTVFFVQVKLRPSGECLNNFPWLAIALSTGVVIVRGRPTLVSLLLGLCQLSFSSYLRYWSRQTSTQPTVSDWCVAACIFFWLKNWILHTARSTQVNCTLDNVNFPLCFRKYITL